MIQRLIVSALLLALTAPSLASSQGGQISMCDFDASAPQVVTLRCAVDVKSGDERAETVDSLVTDLTLHGYRLAWQRRGADGFEYGAWYHAGVKRTALVVTGQDARGWFMDVADVEGVLNAQDVLPNR